MKKSTNLQQVFGLFLPLYLPAFLFSFSNSTLTPVLPLFAQSLDASYGLVGLVLAGEALGMLLTDIPAGMVLRRLGQKGTMTAGLLLNGISTILIFFAPSLGVVVLMRILAGMGTSLFAVSRHFFIAEKAPAWCRGQVTSMFGGFFRMGRLLGPLAGGLVAGAFGLRASFLSFGITCFSALAIVVFFLPSVEIDECPDPAGPVTAGGHLLAMLKDQYHTLLRVGPGVLCLQLMRSGPQVVVPLYAANILGLDVSAIGVVMSIGSTLDMLLFYPAGILMDRLGRKFAIVPSLLMMAVGIALVPFTQNAAALVAVAMLTGLGNGLSSGALLTLGSDLAPPGGRSEFLGMWTLMGDLGTTTGPLAVGSLADVIPLPATAWVIASAGLAGAAIFTFLVPEPVKRQPLSLPRLFRKAEKL